MSWWCHRTGCGSLPLSLVSLPLNAGITALSDQWNNYKILFSFNAVKFYRYNIEPECSVRWLSSAVAQACPRLQERSATGGGNWSRNASRNGFWDRYWGHTSQLLANFSLSLVKIPQVFAEVNSAQFPSVASRVAGSRRFNVAAKRFDSSPLLSSRELNPAKV